MNEKNDLAALSKLALNMKGAQDAPALLAGGQLSTGKAAMVPAQKRYFESPLIVIIWLIFLTIATMAIPLCSNWHLNDYWAALPFQFYWSYWIFKINHSCALRYQCAPPLSNKELMIVSICNFLLLPLLNGYHFIRMLDPFFYLWLLTLGYMPAKVGNFLDQQDRKENDSAKRTHLDFALCFFSMVLPTAVALTQLISPAATISSEVLFGFCWFLSQFSWISYAAIKLTGRLEPTAVLEPAKVYAGTNIVLRYRAFPELERWLQQKFSVKQVAKGSRLFFMWVGGPTIVLFTVLGLSFLVGALRDATHPIFSGANSTSIASANLMFIFQFIFGIAISALAGTIYILSKPTHLALGEQGVRFLWRNRFFKIDGKYVPWSKMTNIFIEQAKSQSSISANKLCFRDNQNHITKLRLNAIDSYEDKELLLNSIRTWAAKVSRDAQVVEDLQPPSDYSYTELWLQALTAPPKRERFKPLIAEALLKNSRYRVINSLGSGGQGFAYLAEDCSDRSVVVLKEFILPVYVDVAIRKSALKQFENEARILSQLQHPQIVRLLDFFVEDHRAYLVLEHIDGSSMRAIVESSGTISETNCLSLAHQMCDILAYLHSQIPPVVHRDFTPDNLILGKDGVLKLIDFNVAQNTESTTTGTVVGKPAYLPPEQFRGMPTSQSDIYAMGATLFFLLTACDPKPISVSHPIEINTQVNHALDALIARATDLDNAKRYSDIAQLKVDLENIA